MNKKLNFYQPLCRREDIGKLWSPTAKIPANSITKVYATNKNKQLQYEMIDLGAYCVLNDVNGEMLKLLVEYGNKFATRFKGMTEEDLQEFENFKRFKLFQESKQ